MQPPVNQTDPNVFLRMLGEALDAAAPLRTTGCRAEKDLSEPRGLDAWQALGVRTANGEALPKADMAASLLRTDAGSFLVYRNYEVFLSYNCAHAYAMAVARLSDRIADDDPLPSATPVKKKATPKKRTATKKPTAGKKAAAKKAAKRR